MILRMLVAGLLLPFCLTAQELADTSRLGLITVRSQPSGATVYVDSVYAGRTPLDRHRLPEGEHRITVFYPSPSDWNAFVQQKSLHVEGGSEVESSFDFGTLLTLHSVPSGAVVSFQGNELGRTPLFFRSNAPIRGSVTVGMKDHKSVIVPIQERPSVVRLERVGEAALTPELTVEFPSAALPRQWMTISSAAGMVVSGVAAAYFKDRANKQFERYSSTNDPSFLSSTHQYDRLSLVSLIITQATFALLIYSLLSDN